MPIPPNHPEARCQECAGPNISWFAPNEIWNRVDPTRMAILCPQCFVSKAEALGIVDGWRIAPGAGYHLIEAAPDLLACAKECETILARMDTLRHIESQFPALDNLRAAIAKATQ